MSCVDYLWIIVMFLSAVWTLILMAPIDCTGEKLVYCNAKFLKSVPMKNSASWMAWRWVCFHFWWTGLLISSGKCKKVFFFFFFIGFTALYIIIMLLVFLVV